MTDPALTLSDDEDQALLAALNEVQRHLGEWSFEALANAYEGLQASFAERFTGRPGPLLDLRRVVADHLLAAAHECELPVDAYESHVLHAMRLGWATLEWKATALFAFGRYCVDHGAPEVMRRYAEPLVLELEVEARRTAAPYCGYFLPQLRVLLAPPG